MTIQRTRWSPDTCDCIIEYEWDDAEPSETRNHNLSTYVKRCSDHAIGNIPTDSNRFDVVKEENVRKNNGLDTILQNAPTSLFDIDAESGSRVFKRGITVNWTWTGTAPNRNIAISITGITLTTQQKNNLKTFLDNRFGVGKVVLA